MCNKLQEIIPWQDEKAGYDEHRGFVTITSAAPKPLIRKHPRKRAIGGEHCPRATVRMALFTHPADSMEETK
jgi:hypothetical protein